jgi:hypothetical protein
MPYITSFFSVEILEVIVLWAEAQNPGQTNFVLGIGRILKPFCVNIPS